MEDSKKDILSKLYCIKAGLSAISIEKDKVSKEENGLNTISKNIQENERKIADANVWIERVKNNIRASETGTENVIKSRKGKPKYLHQIGGLFAGAGAGALLSPIVIIVGSFLIGFVAAAMGKDTSAAFYFMEHGIIFLYGLIGCTIAGAPIGMLISYVSEMKAYKADQEFLKNMTAKTNETVAEYTKNLRTYEDQLNTHTNALNKGVVDYRTRLEKYNDVVAVSVPASQTLYSALVNEFNTTLDSRDWKHIDLIIFYYETGRADTLKEALQQVDRQVQTDTIVKEIKNASRNISETIKNSIGNLQSQMVMCFDKLSVQLDTQHKETMSKLTKIEVGINKLNDGVRDLNNSIKEGNAIADQIASNMSRIADATYLQNALLERISVDSMSLVKDTHYIVDYKTPKSIVEFKIPTVVALDNKNSVSSKKAN